MEMREVIQILNKRLWIVLVGTLLVSGAVLAGSLTMAPVYQAKVTLMLNQPNSASITDYLPLSSGEDLALTYSELLKTRPLLEIVIANLSLNLSPDELEEKMLGTSLVADTQLLELTIEDTDPQRASDIANEIALTFVSLRNTEQQLEDIVALQDDVTGQIADVKQAISSSESRTTGLLTEEQANLAQTTLATQQQAYAQLLATYLDVRLTQSQLHDISVVEPAVPPTRPIRPDVALYTILGTCLGLIVSVGVAFFAEYLDHSLETSEDVTRILPLPALGNIPRTWAETSQRGDGLVTLATPASPSSEAYRVLRTNLRYASVDNPPTTLLITSGESGTGKTTVAANLGVVCAQAGLNVILVDADLRRPALHRSFGVSDEAGLTDLLADSREGIERGIVETDIPNLRLMTSGAVPPNPSELLESNRMQTILAEAGATADLVILDAPPVLPVTDAVILAAKVDGVILLVEAGQTSHETARRAWGTLDRVGANVLGVVLTKTKLESESYYEYYDGRTPRRRRRTWKRPFGRESLGSALAAPTAMSTDDGKSMAAHLDQPSVALPERQSSDGRQSMDPSDGTRGRILPILMVRGDVKRMAALGLGSAIRLLPANTQSRAIRLFSRTAGAIWRRMNDDSVYRVRRHLEVLCPQQADGRLDTLVKEQLTLASLNALIISLLPSLRDEPLNQLVRVMGLHHLDERRTRRETTLLLGAHYGTYGYAIAAALSGRGYPTHLVGYGGTHSPPPETSLLYRKLYWPRVRRLNQRVRMTTIDVSADLQPELNEILQQSEEIVYLLADQYFAVQPGVEPPDWLVPVEFLGGTVYLDFRVLQLAKEEGASPLTAIPVGDRSYQLVLIEPFQWAGEGTSKEDIAEDLQLYMSRLERRISEYPALWRDLRRPDLLVRMSRPKERDVTDSETAPPPDGLGGRSEGLDHQDEQGRASVVPDVDDVQGEM